MKPIRRERERRGDDEDVAVRVDEGGREREARRGDDAEAAREPVHVVEQVERVREPDEPEDPDRPGRASGSRRTRPRSCCGGRGRRRRAGRRASPRGAGGRCRRAGRTRRRSRPRRPPSASRSESRPVRSRSRRRPAMAKPAKIPIPPNAGVGLVCQRSGRGSAPNALSARGQRSSPAMTKKAIGAAAMATSAFTAVGMDACGIDRRSLTLPVGGHGARQHSPYNPRGGRLRRSDPLSRAVREPLPARSAREVQGIGPRARVDARVAGDADARLPRRLLGDVEVADDRRRPLLAVPALRPAAVGVLRDIAAVVGAEPAREREPDPQGALPAAARAALDRRDAARRVRRDDGDRARARDDRAARFARDGVARDPDRRRDRPVRLGAVARRRLGERDLPGHRVRRRGAAPAALLPHAGPLQPRQPSRAPTRTRGSST